MNCLWGTLSGSKKVKKIINRTQEFATHFKASEANAKSKVLKKLSKPTQDKKKFKKCPTLRQNTIKNSITNKTTSQYVHERKLQQRVASIVSDLKN